MKTVTNYAEKKAKQFLNLLQGYTKGIRFTAILILLLMGVSNMRAADITSDGTARLYFNMSTYDWWISGNGDNNFAYFFNDSKSAWSAHSVKYSGNTYYVVIPKGTWNTVILTRNNTTTTPSWDNKWNQSTDITLSSTSNYLSKFKDTGNSGSTVWGTAIKPASTGSLSASSTSVNIGANVTLTPSLTSNQTINDINSTTYSISPNSGASTSNNTFTATTSGTYTVTATITYNPDGYTSLTSEVSPTVTITVNPWTITWNPNGGSVTPTSSTYDGATAVSLPTPTRTGYNFNGWYTAASGGTKINDIGTTTKPTGNVTYYAHWTPKTYAITLNANGGASNGSATATYNSSSVSIASHPTRTDYRCNGYFTAATDGTLVLNTDGTLAKSVSGYTDANGNWTKDGNATLHAQWTYDVTEYTVTFGAGTGFTSYGSLNAYNNTTSASITSPAQVRSGQSITFTATPETGYIVEGWYTDAACTAGKHDAGSTTYTTSIIGKTNVYVKFVEQTWPVSFVASTGGTVSPAEGQTVGVITGVNISATPETGYTFADWTSSTGGEFGDATAAETTFKPTAETTVTANFTENLFAITVTSSDNNHGTVTQSTDKAGIATTITITATPEDGYQFAKWTATDGIIIAEATNATTTITTTRAGSLTAHFEKIPPQTIYLDPGIWTSDNARFSVFYWNNTNPNGSWAEMVKVDANSQYYVVDIPAGYEDLVMVRLKPESENDWKNVWNQTGNLTIPTNGNNLYVLDGYLHLKPNSNWTTDNARFAAYFFGNGEKWVDLVKKGDYYTCEIPTDKNYPSVIFCRMNPANKENNWGNKWNQTVDLTIEKENNLYTIGNEAWDENNENKGAWSRLWDDSQWSKYTPSTTIQEQTGDYRMVYVESEVIGQAPYTKFHPAHSISKITEGTKQETVSFYINKDGQNPAILLQQCAIDGTTIEWTTIDVKTINGNDGANPAIAHAPAKKAVELYIGEGCPAITGNGVYNFVLEQTNDDSHTAQILVDEIEPYNGNYYIRTYCTKGGWDNYQENPMTYSETARSHGGYDYYFCEWILRGKNIKYAVANDYSLCISDTLSSDDITNASTLPADANVRFTWNSETNHLERAYLAGSGNASDRFLVLEGDETLKDVNGTPLKVSGLNPNEAIFKDLEDWQYQVDVKADKNTKVQLTAKYNNQVQYFKGSATEEVQILEGGTRAYKIRLIYDFKTNYIITALIDDEPITEEIAFEEVMIIREHHNPAQSLNITTGSITGIKNLYAVMTFYKDQLNDDKKTEHERALYWVSFPFDVKLDEAFGSGNYGEHWIMEYYDGAERAEKGGWVDATYWKLIENPTDIILKAGVGYVLCLDLDKLGKSSPVYGKSDHINIYFPSAADISIISAQALEDIEVPAHDCTIQRPTPDGDRTTRDDNWNIIGVPSYTDVNSDIIEQVGGIVNFYYQYNAVDNTYSPEATTATSFKTMHAYMVQYAGTIHWSNLYVAPIPAQMAARRNAQNKNQYTLRLALQQEGADYDHTFIRLQEDKATAEFDMNYDLCKIINSGANIYSMINNVEVAANVLPVEERVIPIGLDIHETGNYTFAMPDGTDGITAILIDYETGKETNLLLADYTTELREGTNNGRFALRVRPNHVATAVETIIDGANGQIQKYIINGALYILNNGQLYDAQGRMVQP